MFLFLDNDLIPFILTFNLRLKYQKSLQTKYELDILSKFDKSSYHIILKPVSAGITTLCLYWLVHKAVVNDDWKNRSVGTAKNMGAT